MHAYKLVARETADGWQHHWVYEGMEHDCNLMRSSCNVISTPCDIHTMKGGTSGTIKEGHRVLSSDGGPLGQVTLAQRMSVHGEDVRIFPSVLL